MFNFKDELTLHFRENPEVHKKIYCESCDNYYPKDLLNHNKKVHGEKVKVGCNYCGKFVATKHVLEQHINAVHKGIKFACVYCNKKISRKQDLQTHINAMHKGMKIECTICGAKLYKKAKLVEHLKRFHDIEVRQRDLHIPQSTNLGTKPIIIKQNLKKPVTKSKLSVKLKTKPKFDCEYCGKSFQNSNTKTSHINRVHGRNLD